jgi:hypothetical protein
MAKKRAKEPLIPASENRTLAHRFRAERKAERPIVKMGHELRDRRALRDDERAWMD